MDTTTKTPKACIGDMFPSVFPGMPMFAYVPNPYDCGRPAKVYPGDNTYYCTKNSTAQRGRCRGCRIIRTSSHGMPHHESVLRHGHARAGRCC